MLSRVLGCLFYANFFLFFGDLTFSLIEIYFDCVLMGIFCYYISRHGDDNECFSLHVWMLYTHMMVVHLMKWQYLT